jgi:predicted dehydrogenase
MNIAILGAGSIVPDFLDAASRIDEINVYAIWGRESSLERMKGFKNQYSIDRIYTDYEELLSDENLDAVYVALPNSLHYPYAKQALEHGKCVIVEKPFASTYEQAKDLVECADSNRVMVFEAVSNQYMPSYKKTAMLLDKIGDIKLVQLNFSQYSRRYDKFKEGIILPVFDAKQSGGALMDINVYNVHFVLGLFGAPKSFRYFANTQKGIDTSGILTMEYDNFQCVCIGAKDSKSPASINIQGDGGYLHSDDTANVYNEFLLCLNNGETQHFSLNEGMPRLYYELREFVDMVNNKNFASYEKYCRHTLEVQKILDGARSQVGIIV